jgi:hypothetical protein
VGRVNPETPDQISGPGEPRPTWRTGRRLAVAGVAAVALAVGGVAVAAAATSDAPSPSSSASPSPGSSASPGAPDRDKRERGPFLAGTVVSASGGTITITDFQGFQRTIHTSSSTTYEDGLTATPAAGTKIVAEGTVDSDKTSLAATRVAKLPDRPEGRGPGHGFPGPGGRHHDRDASPGPASSGTPSPGTPSPETPSPGTPSPGTPSPSPGTASPGETSPSPTA